MAEFALSFRAKRQHLLRFDVVTLVTPNFNQFLCSIFRQLSGWRCQCIRQIQSVYRTNRTIGRLNDISLQHTKEMDLTLRIDDLYTGQIWPKWRACMYFDLFATYVDMDVAEVLISTTYCLASQKLVINEIFCSIVCNCLLINSTAFCRSVSKAWVSLTV